MVRLREHFISSGTLEDQEQDQEGQDQGETTRTEVVDSSSERSWCTHYGSAKCFDVPSNLFVLLRKGVLCATGPKVQYFIKISNNFNKQGIKWKLIIAASYEKNQFFLNFKILAKKIFFTAIFFNLFSVNMYFRF